MSQQSEQKQEQQPRLLQYREQQSQQFEELQRQLRRLGEDEESETTVKDEEDKVKFNSSSSCYSGNTKITNNQDFTIPIVLIYTIPTVTITVSRPMCNATI